MGRKVHADVSHATASTGLGAKLRSLFACGSASPANVADPALPAVSVPPTVVSKVSVETDNAKSTPTASSEATASVASDSPMSPPPVVVPEPTERPDSPPVPALLAKKQERPASPPVPALLHKVGPATKAGPELDEPAMASPVAMAAPEAEAGEEGEPAWARRRDAMTSLLQQLKTDAGDVGEMLAAIHAGLEDKVRPVYFAAFDAFRALVKARPERYREAAGAEGAPPLIPVLVHKMADKNRRTEREAGKCVMRVARTAAAGGVGALAAHLGNGELPLRPRLLLLRLVLREFKGALPLPVVMGVAVPALQLPEEKTRKAAVAVVVAAHAVHGNRVRGHLSALKPALLQVLQRKFDAGASGSDSPQPARRGPRGRPNTVASLPRVSGSASAYLPALDRVGTAPAAFATNLADAEELLSSV